MLVFLAHLAGGLLFLSPGYIRPDSVAVYSYLRSAVFDHDLLFYDEWDRFGMIVDGVPAFKEVTPLGTLANHWWVGTALLAAPPYVAADLLTRVFPGLGRDGFFGLHGALLAWWSVALGALVSLMIDALLRRQAPGLGGGGRAFVLAALWLGTPLFWYAYRFPLGTHMAGAFCVGALCLLLFRLHEPGRGSGPPDGEAGARARVPGVGDEAEPTRPASHGTGAGMAAGRSDSLAPREPAPSTPDARASEPRGTPFIGTEATGGGAPREEGAGDPPLSTGGRRRVGLRDPSWLGAAVGLALGLAIASRIQHVTLVPAVLYFAMASRRGARFYGAVILGMVPPLAVQGIAWLTVYGSPWGPLSRGGGLGGTTWLPFQRAAFLPVLLSSWHGLFSWCPVLVFAVAGWIVRARRERILSVTLILMFLGELVANATFDRYFWGGMSFGPRRFVDLAVPFALGLGSVLEAARAGQERRGRVRAALVAVAIGIAAAWTVLLAAAATSGSLDLSVDVSGGDLARQAFSLDTWRHLSPALLRSPVIDPILLGQSLLALAVLGLFAPAVLWACRAPRGGVLAVFLGLAAAIVCAALMLGPTRARAELELSRLGIDRTRGARLGPLRDQKKLLQHELSYEVRTGRDEDARETRRMIESLERAISEVR